MDGITVLHGGMSGLIEWAGDGTVPLLRLSVAIDDTPVDLRSATWRRLDRWLPAFSITLDDESELSGVICAPAGYPAARGFILRVELENRSRTTRSVRAVLDVDWCWSRLRIATARPLAGPNRIAADAYGTVTLETDAGRGPTLAIAAHTDAGAAVPESAQAENGTTLKTQLDVKFDVASKIRGSTTFCIGVGRERDGAIAAAAQLRRTGADQWLRRTRLELSHTLRSAQTHRWSGLLNRNLVFNRFFAAGRGIDDDRVYLVRSRSPYSAAPALFNDREALFWTLPALMIADPSFAREAILRVLDAYSERSGEHTRYIDGGAFDAGFVLDQFLLYPWLIDTYVTSTGDVSLFDEPMVRQIVFETDGGAFMRLHPQHVLASTDLLPSGEPADYPYATMANAVLHAFCSALERLPWIDLPPVVPTTGGEAALREAGAAAAAAAADLAPRLAGAAGEVSAAIWRHCVTDVDGQPLLVSSADLAGKAAVYDDPAMSLALLPLFGVCTTDDPVWRATMEFLRSPAYPLWRDGVVAGTAGRSSAHAQFAALCADLHGHAPDDARDRLLRVELPAGVAAATYDPHTGIASDPHHAALAGFLAWSLVRVSEPAPKREGRKKSRR
ncbi:MAG TPA: glycoside hydrolase family 125 protein [Longimicrobiales bacterium]|nr:glycoside hydrolase family 125 protein [Longimicrobiales bacterium]